MLVHPQKVLFFSLVGGVFSFLSMVHFPQDVLALCAAPENPKLLGIWETMNSDSQGIQRVQIDYLCEDALSCDESTGDCTELRVGYFVNVLQSSDSKDYEWGQKKAMYRSQDQLLQAIDEDNLRTTTFQASVLSEGSRKGQLLLNWTQSKRNQDDADAGGGSAYFTKSR